MDNGRAMMKRAVITGERQAGLVDCVVPQPKEDWVLVKTMAIPLCTEYKGWLAGHGYTGHEAAGVVEAVGPYSTRRKVGDRVVVMPGTPCGRCELCVSGDYLHCEQPIDYMNYTGLGYGEDTHVQYLIKQDFMLLPIPDGVSFEMGALACCGLGPTFGALERYGAGAFDTALITGAGPVGLGGVVNAKYRGCKVICVEGHPYRRDLALELGADVVLDHADPGLAAKIKEITGGMGVDVALEVSGTVPGARTCIDALRRRGSMYFIGENNSPIEIRASDDFIRKRISVNGQWHYNINGGPRIMEVIQKSPAARKLITHRFPMSRINDALAVCATHDCGKVMLDPLK